MKFKIIYKRILPHIQPLEYPFFVTFRLYDSLPVKCIIDLQNEQERELKRIAGINSPNEKRMAYKEYQMDYFEKFDGILNRTIYGPKWFTEKTIANVLQEAIHFRDGNNYELIAYTIMSNHVHIIFIPIILSSTNLNYSTLPDSTPIYGEEETRNSVSRYGKKEKSKQRLDIQETLSLINRILIIQYNIYIYTKN